MEKISIADPEKNNLESPTDFLNSVRLRQLKKIANKEAINFLITLPQMSKLEMISNINSNYYHLYRKHHINSDFLRRRLSFFQLSWLKITVYVSCILITTITTGMGIIIDMFLFNLPIFSGVWMVIILIMLLSAKARTGTNNSIFQKVRYDHEKLSKDFKEQLNKLEFDLKNNSIFFTRALLEELKSRKKQFEQELYNSGIKKCDNFENPRQLIKNQIREINRQIIILKKSATDYNANQLIEMLSGLRDSKAKLWREYNSITPDKKIDDLMALLEVKIKQLKLSIKALAAKRESLRNKEALLVQVKSSLEDDSIIDWNAYANNDRRSDYSKIIKCLSHLTETIIDGKLISFENQKRRSLQS